MSVEIRINKNYGTFQLNIDFSSDSRRIGILGASGCGKSLTLKHIAGIEKPDRGRIAVNGKVMFDSDAKISLTPQERHVGYLFQNYALFPTMTVEKNIGIGLKCGKAEREAKVREMIERFHLRGLEQRLPSELSGGQQQRVALARIMIYEPDVILLDEPFSALDIYLKERLQQECMEMLADYRGTVILVSHNRDEIYRFSEETVVIDAGQMIVQKPTKELFEQPELTEAARLTGCGNIAGLEKQENGGRYIPDWDIRLPDSFIIEEADAAGVRAYDFLTERSGDEEITFPVTDAKVTEDVLEYTVTFRPSEHAGQTMEWKVSKYIWNIHEKGIPKKLYLRKENILLLRKKVLDKQKSV